MEMSRYVYLGKRVKDVKAKGLDSPREFRGIKREIIKDYRSGRINEKKARGRLLLLYRLTFPSKNAKVKKIPKSERAKIRKEIKKAMKEL